MTAAAAEAWGGEPSQVAEQRPSLGWGGHLGSHPRAGPARCPVPTLPGANGRELRKPLVLCLWWPGQSGPANALSSSVDMREQGPWLGHGSSGPTCYVTSKSLLCRHHDHTLKDRDSILAGTPWPTFPQLCLRVNWPPTSSSAFPF